LVPTDQETAALMPAAVDKCTSKAAATHSSENTIAEAHPDQTRGDIMVPQWAKGLIQEVRDLEGIQEGLAVILGVLAVILEVRVDTKEDMVVTQQALADIREDLVDTREDPAGTKEDLAGTKEDMAVT